MTKRNTTIIVILLAILAAVVIIKGPEANADTFSQALGRSYATVTDACMQLKLQLPSVVPISTTACDIASVAMGGATTQFDIINPYASNTDVARVTFDGTGTNPEWWSGGVDLYLLPGVGAIVEIACQNFSAGNNGYFLVTTQAVDYIEFTNAANVVEPNVTIGTGTFKSRIWEETLGNAADSTTQFDITNTGGNTYRYTYDATGTDPGINTSTVQIGDRLHIASPNLHFNINNCGLFTVTGSGDNFFEVQNLAGVAESNVTIGNGHISNRGIAQ